MKYHCEVEIGEDLYDYLKGEERDMARNNMKVVQKDGKCLVVIEADDAVALRSCFNTLGQSLVVWEKMDL